MRAKLEGLNGYKTIKDKVDPINLIKAIKGMTYQFEGPQYHSMALHQAKRSF
jgi:hypothetical protein